MNNALSCLRNIDTKSEFAEALVRGLGGNLNYEKRSQLANTIYQAAMESPADP